MTFYPLRSTVPEQRTGAAVEVRSAAAGATSSTLVCGRQSAELAAQLSMPDGTMVFAVDAMTVMGGALVGSRGIDMAVTVHITDLVATAVRERVRSRVALHGVARSLDPGLLDSWAQDDVVSLLDLPRGNLWVLTVQEARLDRDGVVTVVSGAEYSAACPDPLRGIEVDQLQHLAADHPEAIDRLSALLDASILARAVRVVPVGLVSGGLTLRAEFARGHTDVLLPFRTPARSMAGLGYELLTLLASAPGAKACGECRPTVPSCTAIPTPTPAPAPEETAP